MASTSLPPVTPHSCLQFKADLQHAKQDADQAAHKLASAWHGPDSTRFQSQWKNDANHIDQTVLDVTEMHKKLQAELAEQVAASN